MNEFVFEILRCLLILTIMLVAKYIIPLLKVKAESSNLSWLYDWAIYAVKAAQQTIKGSGMGEAKKFSVKTFLITLTKAYGITITDSQLENLIEAAVYAMKQEDGKCE